MPEIVRLAAATQTDAALPSDTIADPFAGGDPPRTSNRILGSRPIHAWENYYLSSAIYSVAKHAGYDEEALEIFPGENGNKGTHFFSAITGDMFTPMYDAADTELFTGEGINPIVKPCDSGYTACFFTPQVVKRAYAAFGRACVYVSAVYIKANLRAVMNAIKASIDEGIPVLSWGWRNTKGDMTEGCFIGGYENEQLYVNGPEWMAKGFEPSEMENAFDDDGYFAATEGLSGCLGLFFVGEPIEKTPSPQVYRDAIAAIPARLTLSPAGHIIFGKAAFYHWADVLLDEMRYTGKTDDELGKLIWGVHCKSFCNVCTSNADHFIRAAVSEVEIAAKLLPLYERFFKCKDRIWKLSGGFSPPAKKFRQRKFREKIAALLREMGAICGEILAVFEEA